MFRAERARVTLSGIAFGRKDEPNLQIANFATSRTLQHRDASQHSSSEIR
jgi:hypothetical protein